VVKYRVTIRNTHVQDMHTKNTSSMNESPFHSSVHNSTTPSKLLPLNVNKGLYLHGVDDSLASHSATEGIWKDQLGKHYLWCSFEKVLVYIIYLAIALKVALKD